MNRSRIRDHRQHTYQQDRGGTPLSINPALVLRHRHTQKILEIRHGRGEHRESGKFWGSTVVCLPRSINNKSVTATRPRCSKRSQCTSASLFPNICEFYLKLLSPGRRQYRKLINNHCRARSAFPKCEFMFPDLSSPPECEDLVPLCVLCLDLWGVSVSH